LSASNFGFDVFLLLEHAFPADEVGHTFDEDVHERSLRLTEAIGVGDIVETALGCGIDTSTTTGLEAQLSAEVLEVLAGREQRDLNHGSSSETSSEVGRAGQNVTKMVVVHEVLAHALKHLSDD